jgi:hypothetical protein
VCEGIPSSGRVVGVEGVVQGGVKLRGSSGELVESGVVRLFCIIC